jgi:hypothetical protein
MAFRKKRLNAPLTPYLTLTDLPINRVEYICTLQLFQKIYPTPLRFIDLFYA